MGILFKLTLMLYLALLPSMALAASHKPVSLISLIAAPESFVGSEVVVRGYLSFNKLFLNEDSARISDTFSSVFVLDPTKDGALVLACEGKYVTVFGRFVRHKTRFEINEVTRVIDIIGLEDCWRSDVTRE